MKSSTTLRPAVGQDASAAHAGAGAAAGGHAAVAAVAHEYAAAAEWLAWIEGEQLAMLETGEVPDADAPAVAALCLQHAEAHPKAVQWVLHYTPNVRQEAAELLKAGAQCDNVACEPGQQVALALRILESCHEIEVARGDMAPEVAELLELRDKEFEAYCLKKGAKHGVGPDTPFLYANWMKYRDENFNVNGALSPVNDPGVKFVCRHLALAATLAVQNDPDQNPGKLKEHLSKLAQADVTTWDCDALNRKIAQRAGAPTINFTPDNYGSLLARLSLYLGPKQCESYRVSWWNVDATGKNISHAMAAFLGKLEGGWFKPQLVEPNVSANAAHLRTPPERIRKLDFDGFDKRRVREASGVGVLALDLDHRTPQLAAANWQLARRCAGVFVTPGAGAQLDSLAQALANGNPWELRSALEKLGDAPPVFQGAQIAQLAYALHIALQEGFAEVVSLFLPALKRFGVAGVLTSMQIEKIAAAKDPHGTPGLYVAYEKGHSEAVEVSLAGLCDLGGARLLVPAQIEELAAAKNADGTPGLHRAYQFGHSAVVEVSFACLGDLGGADLLMPAQIGEIVAANDADGTPGLHRAYQFGHSAAVQVSFSGLADLGIASLLVPAQIGEIAAAKDPRGTPGLYTAYQFGHSAAAEASFVGLDKLGCADLLVPAQIGEIVAAKDADGTPGLYKAYQFGHSAAVEVSLVGLGNLGGAHDLGGARLLVPAQIVEIAAAKDPRGTPGLYVAYQNGHSVVVQVSLAGLGDLGGAGFLVPTQIVEIAAAKDPRGTPGLYRAYQHGHSVAVEVSLAGLGHLGNLGGAGRLLPVQIEEIAAAKDRRGIGGLHKAYQFGHSAAVQVSFPGLRNLGGADLLTRAQIDEIVAGKGPSRILALLMMLLNGHADTVPVFLAGMRGVPIPFAPIMMELTRALANRRTCRTLRRADHSPAAELKALSTLATLVVQEGMIDSRGAAKLLSALRVMQGPRRWYLAGWRTNGAAYTAVKKDGDDPQPYEAFKKAKKVLKAHASR